MKISFIVSKKSIHKNEMKSIFSFITKNPVLFNLGYLVKTWFISFVGRFYDMEGFDRFFDGNVNMAHFWDISLNWAMIMFLFLMLI